MRCRALTFTLSTTFSLCSPPRAALPTCFLSKLSARRTEWWRWGGEAQLGRKKLNAFFPFLGNLGLVPPPPSVPLLREHGEGHMKLERAAMQLRIPVSLGHPRLLSCLHTSPFSSGSLLLPSITVLPSHMVLPGRLLPSPRVRENEAAGQGSLP